MPTSKDLSNFVFQKTYSKGATDTWAKTSRRILQFFLDRYKDKNIDDIIKDACKYVAEKKVLSSQRLAQYAGDAITKNNLRAFNCTGTVCDRPEVFAQAFYILLSGSGAGVSVQQHHVDRLSPVSLVVNETKITHVIEDSIEGWADAVKVLLANNLEVPIKGFEQYHAKNGTVVFDYIKIRAEGTPIKSGGKAPGPKPLRVALKKIKEILENTKKTYNRRLTPLNCIDILCHVSDATLAGGIRRSATIVLISPTDQESINSKTGQWYIENPQRGRVNISVVLNTNTVTKKQFIDVLGHTYQYGEPGFVFVRDNEYSTNPCFTGDMRLLTVDGYKTFESLSKKDKFLIIAPDGYQEYGKVWCSGKKETVKLTCQKSNGEQFCITCTPDHKFVEQFNYGVDRQDVPAHLLTGRYLVPDTREFVSSVKGKKTKTYARELAQYAYFHKITVISVEPNGEQEVYDFSEPHSRHGIVEGVEVLNCGEVGFYPYLVTNEEKYDNFMKTYDGTGYKGSYEDIGVISGVGVCNLTTVNTSNIEDEEDLLRRVEAAAVIGTLQAGLDDMGYLGEVSSAIVKRDALLGVSLSGIMVNPQITLNPDTQKKLAKKIKETNVRISKLIGINQAARTTVIKPDGNSGCILGCSPSIMPYHSRRYLRWVQIRKNHPVAEHFLKYNPHAVQQSAYAETDYNIAFPIEAPPWSHKKTDINGIELLEYIKSTQQNYILEGNTERNQPWLNNNVSNTVNVKSEEWFQVGDYIWDNKEFFGGITLMRADVGELEYAQAPFTSVAVSEKELRLRYHISQGILEELSEFAKEVTVKLKSIWNYSFDLIDGEKLNEKNTSLGKLLRKGVGYTEKYFDGDRQLFTYCLKEIYNFDLFNLIFDNWKRPDYKLMGKDFDATLDEENSTAGAACSANGCVFKV